MSQTSPAFDAVLLAGGRSSRMGRDKAFLDWEGQPLYVRQLRKLAALGPERLWLSTHAGQSFPAVMEGVVRLVDQQPDLGPLGGLREALAASRAERVLVLAVDLPRMETAFLHRLLAAEGGAVPKTANGWEPLAAIYPRRDTLALVEDALSRGDLRLQHLVDRLESDGLVAAVPVGERESGLFANVNTPEELAALERGTCDEAAPLVRHRIGEPPATVIDRVAREEPLEIRVNGVSVAVTMRTPGHDDELAAGFLLTEGVVGSVADIAEISHCPEVDPEGVGNVLDVRLRTAPDLARLTRHVFTSSSCGVCGKATIDAVFGQFPPVAKTWTPTADLLVGLPGKLRAAQETFERTGGLHASALFDSQGRLLLLREDVGRHNALDKLIGRALMDDRAMDGTLLLLSGRLSFELVQKSLAARISVVAAISAPSSLAVEFARSSGQTVVGFLRERGFNVYSGEVG